MIFFQKTAFRLAAAFAATVAGAGPAVAAVESVDWCNAGRLNEMAGRPWSSGGAVMPVLEAHRARAERRLERRGIVRVSARYAQAVTGILARPMVGYRHVLVRAGLVGLPDIPISEYLEQRGRARIFASISRDRRTLLVSTHELSPPFPTRRLPVIVMVPNTVVEAVSRCSAGT